MGKQINYYMEYDSFVLLAKKAVELGCEIFGEIKTEQRWGKEHAVRGYNASGVTVIEAGFSYIDSKDKHITRARIYCITDYYDADGNLIKRPGCVTKVHESLARYVKKLAPYTEVEYKPTNPLYDKVKKKVYITPQCLALVREQDYELY